METEHEILTEMWLSSVTSKCLGQDAACPLAQKFKPFCLSLTSFGFEKPDLRVPVRVPSVSPAGSHVPPPWLIYQGFCGHGIEGVPLVARIPEYFLDRRSVCRNPVSSQSRGQGPLCGAGGPECSGRCISVTAKAGHGSHGTPCILPRPWLRI